MADEPSNDLQVITPDAGLAFRAEMFMTSAVMGYWKLIVGVLVTFLVTVLIYGNYQNYYTAGQYETSDEVANVLGQFSKKHPNVIAPGTLVNAYSMYTSAPLALGSDEEMTRHVEIVAKELEKIGGLGSGTAAAQAYLLASEFYRISGDSEGRVRTIDSARAKIGPNGSTSLALASSERDQGDIDASLATLAEIAADEKGTFYAQWALLERSRLLTDLKRIDEAVADLDALIAVYPEGPLKDTADGELEDLDVERPSEVPAAVVPDVPTPEETRSTEAGE